VNARILLALGLSVPEFPFPIEAFGRNPLDPARASGPIRATMPLFVAFPEAGAVSKRCLGSCQSAPEHVRPRLKTKSSKTLQSGTSGYSQGEHRPAATTSDATPDTAIGCGIIEPNALMFPGTEVDEWSTGFVRRRAGHRVRAPE